MRWGPPRSVEPASLPPAGLPDLDPRWSRLVSIEDLHGITRTFHVLDSAALPASAAAGIGAGGGSITEDSPAGSGRGAADSATGNGSAAPVGTVLCVHGNPTWSYLWRRLLAAPPPGWRVVAPDQLGMGYSDRIERARSLSERIDDLTRLTSALGIVGPGQPPVVILAHDWGGIISLGWALRHADQLRGVVLTNTAVSQPRPGRGPWLIRLAQARAINLFACRATPLFVRATTSLTWPRLPAPVRNAFAAPYRTAGRRAAVGEFVADIPFRPGHRSHGAAQEVAAGVRGLRMPALLLWGPRDPVFSEVHLRDLQERMPQATLHRYEQAGHLVPEDAPAYVDAVTAWLRKLDAPPPGTMETAGPPGPMDTPPRQGPTATTPRPVTESVLTQLLARAGDDSIAVSEVGGASISWRELNTRVHGIAGGLTAAGLRPGQRVALLIPPSIDLTVALYAVWRAGGVIVVADKGLGLAGLGRALRGAGLDHLIADTAGLLASRVMRLPGQRLALHSRSAAVRFAGRVDFTLPELPALTDPATGNLDGQADGQDEAAVLFTSGATGPAKGVLYRHRQVRAQLELIRSTYHLTADDRMVAAFAPFALYGPALGVQTVVPRIDVTKPAQLTAVALAEAVAAIGATVVFASPAALRNVVRTASSLSASQRADLATVRLLMSAGASVPAQLLRQVRDVLPRADLHTPYGMTEALPLTDISLAGIEAAGDGDGVCVGLPLPGVTLAIAPLDRHGVAGTELTTTPFVPGEIWAAGPHVRDRYDASWALDMAAAAHPGRHRTGDIGYLDDSGRLWVQGRAVHVISTGAGPVTPISVELRVEAALASAPPAIAASYTGAAAVGVGPVGTQQLVVVLGGQGGPLPPAAVTDLVRDAAGQPVAAVLVLRRLPVDIRHNSKIDRVAVGRWAARVLAGG